MHKLDSFIQNQLKHNMILLYIEISALIALFISSILYFVGKQSHPFLHIIYYFLILMLLFSVVNPKSVFYRQKVTDNKLLMLYIIGTVVFVGILCVLPMGLNPVWSGGELQEHRNQYEELADSLLDGRLYIYPEEDTSALSAMDNPYDWEARDASKVSYHWDHAFYKGHYYVYFGIVPAVLLFIPYKLLFGQQLDGWKATAVFSIFIIIAIFLLGYRLIKKIKSNIPTIVYLVLSSSLSLIIVSYAIKRPALYCTAITSGICFALWSLYFIMDAFYIREKARIWEIFMGALCGALVFGCRPPIGLAEIILLPFIFSSVKKQISEKSKKYLNIMGQIAAFIIPYILIAVLLMWYNYMRFESPFEFGQSYQLTVTDQTSYALGIAGRLSIIEWLNWTVKYMFEIQELGTGFPWITENFGLFLIYPIFWSGLKQWDVKNEKCMKWFHFFLLLGAGIIVESQILNSPHMVVRYRMDFTFLLCLAVLFKVIYKYSDNNNTISMHKYSLFINYMALLALVAVFLQFFTSGDFALRDMDPELTNKLSRFFILHDIVIGNP